MPAVHESFLHRVQPAQPLVPQAWTATRPLAWTATRPLAWIATRPLAWNATRPLAASVRRQPMFVMTARIPLLQDFQLC